VGGAIDELKGTFVQEQNVVPLRPVAGRMVFAQDVRGGNAGFDKIEAVLTKEQKETWKKLTGEAIDFEKLDVHGAHALYRVTQSKPEPVVLPPDK
jgi:hypothetical protein